MKLKLFNNFAVALALFALVFAFAQNSFASSEANINDSIKSCSAPATAETTPVFSVFTDVLISPSENVTTNRATEPSAKTTLLTTYRSANSSAEQTPPISPPSFAQSVTEPNIPDVKGRTIKRHLYADANQRFVQLE